VDYRFLDMNPAFEQLTGLKKVDVVGKTVLNIMPNTESIWIEKYGNVALTGEPISFEDYANSLGRHFKVIAFCPKKNQFAVIFTDITERKQAEAAITAEKERLSVTLRSIGDGVITTDINGDIVLMNRIAEDLTGWKQKDAQGKCLDSVFRIINETTREPHENPVQKVLASGEIIELANHTLLISRDGTERIIADSGAPIKDKDDHTIGVVLVFRDMTEKHKFLEITQNSQKLESLGVLAGGIAHDFNNLMCGIFGYMDMALKETKETKVTTYLSKAMNTIDRARALTGQLLTFAKGGAPIQKIDHLFPFVEETAKFALSGSSVLCNFDVPPDLWACNFDKNQIGQVIDNLIINAQQAMPVGGTIELSARNISLAEKEHPVLEKGDYVKISIKDSGIGIPKELLAKLFDPFFTTKEKGHGLGLATCYSIINRHGGCIDVESEQGKGSTFKVYLPASTENVSSARKKTDKTHKGNGIFMVMDDEEVIRDTISAMLETLGYTIVTKDNGKDAINFFISETKANRKIAGMIFDLTVPGGMGGKAAIEEIRKLNKNIPAFVASGYADDPVMKNPNEYGFMASISKPFRLKALVEMLNRYMKPKK
jgi:PAS domain S-box-containing protein